jgi:hypothetical protein
MPDFAELKRRSRQALHAALSFRAYYFSSPDAEPLEVHVRTHVKNPQMQGDLKGTNLSYAEMTEAPTRLVLDTREVSDPQRGSIFVLSPSEGYIVDHAEPAYRETITVQVSPLSAQELDGLPYPGS